MSETSIQWTDYTFNPWWGCAHVSPGCANCYAETFSHRLGMDLWGVASGRRLFDDHHWGQPYVWWRRRLRGDHRHRVFCASMADVFEDRRDLDGQRARLWAMIEATPELTWQLLTKRPENADKLAPGHWVLKGWPQNVWAMVTAEDQRRADERIPALLRIPARVHGISYEPALGEINISKWLRNIWTCNKCGQVGAAPNASRAPHGHRHEGCNYFAAVSPGLDWVIVGGESGRGSRPFNMAWARSAVQQCRTADVAVFVKQMGSRPFWKETLSAHHKSPGLSVRLESLEIDTTFAFRDSKGGDRSEWPDGVWPRDFPKEAA